MSANSSFVFTHCYILELLHFIIITLEFESWTLWGFLDHLVSTLGGETCPGWEGSRGLLLPAPQPHRLLGLVGNSSRILLS